MKIIVNWRKCGENFLDKAVNLKMLSLTGPKDTQFSYICIKYFHHRIYDKAFSSFLIAEDSWTDCI